MFEANWTPARVRRNFRIDVFSAICAGAFISVLVSFMPVVVRRLGGSTTDVALVVAAPFVGHLLSPVFAYLLAQLSPVRVCAATSTTARAVFLVAVLLAATPLMLAVTTVVFWVITIANIAAYTTLMQGIYPDRERAQAMGKVRIGASIAGLASAALAGVLIDAVPANWVFAGAALFALPGSIVFFAVRYDRPPAVETARRPVRRIAHDMWVDRGFRLLLIAFTIFGAGNLMTLAVFPIMLVDHFDAANSFIGIMSAVQSATMVVSYLIWGQVIDRGSSLRQTLYSTLLVTLVPLGYLVAPSVWALLPVAVVSGIVIAASELTFHTNIVQIAPRGHVGEYMAAQSFLLGVRGTLAPFAASALLGVAEPRVVLVIALAFMLAGAAVLARAVRGAQPTTTAAEAVIVSTPGS